MLMLLLRLCFKKKEAVFARIMMEESLSDSDNESWSRGDSDVVIGDDS